MAVPAVREPLRRIASWRNAGTVAGLWITIGLLFFIAADRNTPLGYAVALRADGADVRPSRHPRPRGRPPAPASATSGPTTSSAAGCSTTRRSCRSTCTAGFTSPTTRTSSAPTNPTSRSTPATRSRPRRGDASCIRDAVGISGWKNLKPLFTSLGSKQARPIVARIWLTQFVLFARHLGGDRATGGSTSCAGWARG